VRGYGHQVGDDYLRTITAALCRTVRTPDTVARYGGEEIAVILPFADIDGAVETAERLRAAIGALRLTHEENMEGGGTSHGEYRRGYRAGERGRNDKDAGVLAAGCRQCPIQSQTRRSKSSGNSGACRSE
jgi:GGDEF domain-containing protein